MIGVVIPMYIENEAAADTARLSVASFKQADWVDVLVVQNGGEWVTGTGAGRLHLPTNLGYTTAVNIGLRTLKARGCDHFVVGSADIIAPPDGIQALMGDGIVCATEGDGPPNTCTHDYACPFWGGVYSFPVALLEDVGYLPEKYSRTGDAAFAARAALLGWEVRKSPLEFEHRHQHSANRILDATGIFGRDYRALTTEFGHDICRLIHDLEAMPAPERLATSKGYRA